MLKKKDYRAVYYSIILKNTYWSLCSVELDTVLSVNIEEKKISSYLLFFLFQSTYSNLNSLFTYLLSSSIQASVSFILTKQFGPCTYLVATDIPADLTP